VEALKIGTNLDILRWCYGQLDQQQQAQADKNSGSMLQLPVFPAMMLLQ